MATKAQVFSQLHRLHIASAVVFALLAVAAGVFMSTASYPFVIGHVGKDALSSQTTTQFAPSIHAVMDVQLKWAVVVIMAIAALFSLLLATSLRNQYYKALRDGIRPLRWLELAITLGLMTEVVAMLGGVQDVVFLKLMAGLVVLMSGLYWLAEKQNLARGTKKAVWSAYIFGVFSAALPWLIILVSLMATAAYGMVRQPWYVYSVDGVLLLGFVLFSVNLLNRLRNYKSWKRYEIMEFNHVVINLVLKASFAIILIIGLKK